jgi:hypothetical protein
MESRSRRDAMPKAEDKLSQVPVVRSVGPNTQVLAPDSVIDAVLGLARMQASRREIESLVASSRRHIAEVSAFLAEFSKNEALLGSTSSRMNDRQHMNLQVLSAERAHVSLPPEQQEKERACPTKNSADLKRRL